MVEQGPLKSEVASSNLACSTLMGMVTGEIPVQAGDGR